MMFTILFGLSMDYEVFLLSRIREEWRLTGDNSIAVADGLAKTARVITAAAAIMICVFGSFVFGDPLHVLKVFGLGLAAAILIDATLVRMVLVPSIMELLGPRQLVDAARGSTGSCPGWASRSTSRHSIRPGGRTGPGLTARTVRHRATPTGCPRCLATSQWRKGGDSNPRRLAPHTLSRRAH